MNSSHKWVTYSAACRVVGNLNLRLHFVLCQSAPPVRSYGQTLEDAVALKEKLLMFDRTLAERSKVFDDQARLESHQ